MSKLKINSNPEVKRVFKAYPKDVKPKIEFLRKLILETAEQVESISELEETLKWGEPSYLVKGGSTIRIDHKAKTPEQYAMYFKCTSKLVSTFKEVYGSKFNYEKTRAILFQKEDKVPVKELKECIEMALRYHKLKDKPRLGK